LKGEKDKELQVLEDLVKKHPNDMNYRVMKGNWLIQNGMHEEAFEEYQFALRQDPKHVAARLSLLDYYRTLDKDSLANALQEDILESPEIPTNDKVMLVRKVVAENEQNGADSTQVLDLFHRVLSKPQHSADMTAMYAAYLQMKNFPQDSINTVYYQALKIEPDNASVRLALIQSLWKEQNFDEIIRLSKEATQYNPDEMAFYYFLGVCYFQKGNNDASLDALRRGVSQINSKSNKEFVSDFYAIMGANGCGKTTLLRLIAGLLTPQEGDITIDGTSVSQYSARQLAQRMAFVRQHPQTDFEFSAFETVLMGRNPYQHRLQNESEADWQIVEQCMKQTNTWHLRFAKPNQMSGGELQRVMIARALAQQTPILLLDEPVSNLDIAHQFEILDLLQQINSEQRKTILLVIHDLNMAWQYCHRLLLLHQGGIQYQGPTREGLTPDNIATVFGVSATLTADNIHQCQPV
jgi:ABC-type cobalamin/Fe3+-siderophores transport system ATPase subunit